MEGVADSARSRFVTILGYLLAGSTMAVGAFTFPANAERWLGLAVGGGCLALVLIAFALPGRSLPQRILDGLLAPICAWTIVASRTIELSSHAGDPHLVRWLGFSSGAAMLVIGIVSLLLHEAGVERDVQWLADTIWEQRRDEAVAVRDFRDTDERDGDAFPRAAG